jgi:hypothetical protein
VGIDTEPGDAFLRANGRVIRHLKKHQDIPMDYRYLDTETDLEFDVRDLPVQFRGEQKNEVLDGDRESHRRVMRRAI